MNDRLSPAGSPGFPHWENRAFSFLALALVAALTGCGRAPAQESTTGGAQRIVSAVPSATETLLELGARARLVARTTFDTDPRIADVPSLGRTMQPGAEAVLSFRPDLFIDTDYQHSTGAARLLQQQGVQVLTTKLATLADVHALIDTLGVLLNLSMRADSLITNLKRRAAQLAASAPRDRPSAVYVFWPMPARIAGGNTYIGEVLELAGARNSFAGERGWPEITAEALLAHDPDYIVVPANRADLSLGALRRLPGWERLSAVRSGRVLTVPADLLEHPGPRALDAALLLARMLRERERRAQ